MTAELSESVVAEIQTRIGHALRSIVREFGLTPDDERFEVDYRDSLIAVGCRVRVPSAHRAAPDDTRARFEQNAGRVGLSADDFLAPFVVGGFRYTLIGVTDRAYPVQGRRETDGRVIQFGPWVLEQIRLAACRRA